MASAAAAKKMRPVYEGVATSTDGLEWQRTKDTPVLSVHDPDCAEWEKDCIYQPWLVEHKGCSLQTRRPAHAAPGTRPANVSNRPKLFACRATVETA